MTDPAIIADVAEHQAAATVVPEAAFERAPVDVARSPAKVVEKIGRGQVVDRRIGRDYPIQRRIVPLDPLFEA